MEENKKPEPKDPAAEARLAKEKFLNEVKVAVNSAAENVNVRLVLKHVLGLSGFYVNPVALKGDGDVAANSTVYNVGRESVYHDLRKFMSAGTKNAVERSE